MVVLRFGGVRVQLICEPLQRRLLWAVVCQPAALTCVFLKASSAKGPCSAFRRPIEHLKTRLTLSFICNARHMNSDYWERKQQIRPLTHRGFGSDIAAYKSAERSCDVPNVSTADCEKVFHTDNKEKYSSLYFPRQNIIINMPFRRFIAETKHPAEPPISIWKTPPTKVKASKTAVKYYRSHDLCTEEQGEEDGRIDSRQTTLHCPIEPVWCKQLRLYTQSCSG